MKTESFTFINTTGKPVAIVTDYIGPDGQKGQFQSILLPKEVASDTSVKSHLSTRVGKVKIEILDVRVVSGGSGGVASIKSGYSIMRPDAFGSAKEILKNSVVLDIETTGAKGGATITEIGMYDVGSGKGKMIVPQPQLVLPAKNSADRGFKNRLGSYANLPKGTTIKEIKYAEALMEFSANTNLTFDQALDDVQRGYYPSKSLEKYILETDFFQGRYYASEDNLLETLKERGSRDPAQALEELKPIRAYMQALNSGDMSEDVINELFRASRGENVSIQKLFKGGFELITDRSMRDILSTDLPESLRGKVTWIANATFESTQFGSQIDADTKEALDALNTDRATKNLKPIPEKDFMARFSYGGYEEELAEINKVRSNPVITKSPMFGTVAGISTSSGKPFFVTGKEFGIARAEAQASGNWSDLYEKLIKTTGPGDVRDVLDLIRIQQSMLIDSKMISTTEKPAALSIEIQSRLYGVTEQLKKGYSLDEAMSRMFEKELHVGIGDTRLSELPVITEALDQIEALNTVRKNLTGKESLISEARLGKGALFRAEVYAKLFEELTNEAVDASGNYQDNLLDVLYKQRAGRYALDISQQGYYDLRENSPGRNYIRQSKEMHGAVVTEAIPRPNSNFVARTNVLNILEDMQTINDYPSANKEAFEIDFKRHFQGTYNEGTGEIIDKDLFAKRARAYSESSSAQIKVIEERFKRKSSKKLEEILIDVQRENILKTTNLSVKVKQPKLSAVSNFSKKTASVISAVGEVIPSKLKKGYVGLGVSLAGLSAVIPKPTPAKNIFLGNEKDYLQSQYKKKGYNSAEEMETAIKSRFNNIEGMSESGIAAMLRKMFTDFGSPYQSPEYSLSVLDNYNLIRERQRYMSAQFGARHFDEKGDIGFFLKSFVSSIFRKNMGIANDSKSLLLGSGRKINSDKYNSLKGDNLIEYSVSPENNITVEDADTITIKNTRNTGRSLKIRLAGIDSPEIAHENRAAQPYAEQAKKIAVDLIRNAKDVKVVMEPGDSTYGRQVGMVYADGINVNLELLKRGAAAYLPYKGKGKPQIYNQKSFEEAQERAYESKRGMWRESYFQAYKAISQSSGQSVTFNTLVNDSKVAKNGHLMSMRAIMDQAQEMGIDNSLNLQIANTAEAIKGSENPFTPDNFKNGWSSMDLQTYGQNTNSILSILDRQKYEIGNLMKTRGSLISKEKAQVSRVGKRNLELTSETLAAKSYKEENEIRQNINRNLEMTKLKRLQTMQYLQQNALRTQFNSPIGHNRM